MSGFGCKFKLAEEKSGNGGTRRLNKAQILCLTPLKAGVNIAVIRQYQSS